ncbi:hypothetical protein RN001_003724 [Aquatica leii]|uniref:Uncharacterized protein n=1 Tax=Aquatica leii TaxID=1421715 RepID=A0AAN7PJ01_9COLE|nr:hypothetical protein RN001_003724 [Aquatica leii]
MEDSEAGPSGVKKPKITFRNSNKLTDEELLAVLEASDSELDDLGSDIDDFVSESESEESSSDESEDSVLPTITTKDDTRSSVSTTDANTSTWSDQASDLKVFRFSRRNELLQMIPDLWQEFFDTFSNEEWQSRCAHSKKCEEEFLSRKGKIDNIVDQLIINVTNTDSGDDWDTESDDELSGIELHSFSSKAFVVAKPLFKTWYKHSSIIHLENSIPKPTKIKGNIWFQF